MYSLINKKILIVSPEAWGSNFVSKHHYAVSLAKLGNEVYFLNPPSSKIQIYKVRKNLYVLDYFKLLRGMGKLPAFLSAFFVKKEISRLEKIVRTSFDIIWNFDSSRFFNLKMVKEKLRIAHLVDLSEHFQRPLLCKFADICLCTSEAIEVEMRKYNDQVYNIGHGYNPGNYESSNTNFADIQTQYSIKAAYIGNLTLKYIDWKTISTIVEDNPNVAFFFIGPLVESNLSRRAHISIEVEGLRKKPNVTFLGAINSDLIPYYLKQMDILLMVYNAAKFRAQLSNPHKILEYMGSGKITVASWTEEYKNKQHLFEMTETNAELPARFKNVVDNLEIFNSYEKQELRKNFALANTYEIQLRRIEKLISGVF